MRGNHLNDQADPGELEQQCERYGCGQYAHGVAVEDGCRAGEHAQAYELEGLGGAQAHKSLAAYSTQ